MSELITRYIGKEVIIEEITSSISGGLIKGKLLRADGGFIEVEEKNGETLVINLNAVSSIRENTKKKNIIFIKKVYLTRIKTLDVFFLRKYNNEVENQMTAEGKQRNYTL